MSSSAAKLVRPESRLLRRLLGALGPYRGRVIASACLMVLHSLAAAAGPVFIMAAVDSTLSRAQPATGVEALLPAEPRQALIAVGLAYAALLLASFVIRSTQIHLMYSAGQGAMRDLRRALFERLQHAEVSFLDRSSSGRLVTRVTGDVEALNEMFTAGVAAVAGDFLALGFIGLAMLWLSPQLTLAVAAVAPLVVGTSWLFRRRLRQAHRVSRRATGRIQGDLLECIEGIETVQVFTRERRMWERFDLFNRELRDAQLQAVRTHAFFIPTIEWFGAIAVAVLLLYGGSLVLQGIVSVGVVAAFLQYGARVQRPVQDLAEKVNVVQGAMAAAERVFELLDRPVENEPEAKALPTSDKGTPAIEFRNVWFAYEDGHWVLQDVSFRVEPGQALALVGHTGAGKSTIVNLILRFYDVGRGTVLVDGRDVREWPREQLRGRFGVVLQDPYVFADSLEENIRMGDPEIDRKAVEKAVEQAGLRSLVRALPHGYQEQLGERGTMLSAGQRQLVAVARALARGPKLLILDEATSRIDSETEHELRGALKRLLSDRPALVVAHRLSTIRGADRILVLHKGRVRESGTHQSLLAEGGIYAKLYNLLYADQEEA